MRPDFCDNLYVYRRRRTRRVRVGAGPQGPVFVGGDEPIRVQSMTTTDTRDTAATVDQVLRLVEAGCEIVRVTTPKVRDAENLADIRAGLEERGVVVPLVADVHFLPAAAMAAADTADKVRINPGNYADRKQFKALAYTDTDYAGERLARIEERFAPLVEKLKRNGRCLRIGTNHGSLSDRIMSRYGDTPEGMVESALEFVRICRTLDYHDIILSMKASNPAVMIAANRLLAACMDAEGMDYPLHLGVTEAGDGEDGRIKSAVGIGSLLRDGIGDTIRVSLTEEPEYEIPVARDLLRGLPGGAPGAPPADPPAPGFDPYAFARREATPTDVGPITVGGAHPPRVACRVDLPDASPGDIADRLRPLIAPQERAAGAAGHDGVEIVEFPVNHAAQLERIRAVRRALGDTARRVAWAVGIALDPALAQAAVGAVDLLVVDSPADPAAVDAELAALNEISATSGLVLAWDLADDAGACPLDRMWERMRGVVQRCPRATLCFRVTSADPVPIARYLAAMCAAAGWDFPLLLEAVVAEPPRAALDGAVALGAPLCDGIGDGIGLQTALPPDRNVDLLYNILQATGRRITKTEFISCPSCGRTKFNLQITTERIKARTAHLKDVRIAIMGCIVNGPGEMADADFGYVGAGDRRISLYVGKKCVERDIPEGEADERLIALIKRHGKWVEPGDEAPAARERAHA